MRRQIGLGAVVVLAVLGGCSTATTANTTTTVRETLNATPCNYARAWHDNPGQFTEFAPLARYAGMAENAHLRTEGRQLASAVTAHNTAAITAVAGSIFAACRQLGLVTTPPAAPSTTG